VTNHNHINQCLITLDSIAIYNTALSCHIYSGRAELAVKFLCEGKERKMILLQICLLPFCVLLLLGAIFAIGSAGVEQLDQSSWIDPDKAWIEERLSTVTTGLVYQPSQAQSLAVSGKVQGDLLQIEIAYDYSIRES
jgi:hypothetical protein